MNSISPRSGVSEHTEAVHMMIRGILMVRPLLQLGEASARCTPGSWKPSLRPSPGSVVDAQQAALRCRGEDYGEILLSLKMRNSNMQNYTTMPTVVLVHGAFTDGSSWKAVTESLQAAGCRVVVPANPLRGLASDSAYVAGILAAIDGPIVLAGHSYGGEVITNVAASNPQVKALVYIAAIMLEKGESANDILGAFPGSQLPDVLEQITYPLSIGGESTDLYVRPERFPEVFAADVSKPEAVAMAAAQRPIDASALGAASENAAWHSLPSWYLVSRNDRVIPPAAQRYMAERAHARLTEVDSSHALMVSQPAMVAQVIEDAVRSVATG
ncbi:alpha/beta fold hydrolase [Streptomyces sp. NPDC048362]|uniref:alpha/beta fold hydrolase n=1 Tax=Streptomyces sp. NPDC048362 TaxID=3365539 RepID=UPI00371002F5